MTHPDKIVAEMQRFSMMLEEQTDWHQEAATAWARADTDYVRAKARARVRAVGSNEDKRRGEVDQAINDLLAAKNMAWAELEAAKEKGRNLRAQLEALRSINANVRGQV